MVDREKVMRGLKEVYGFIQALAACSQASLSRPDPILTGYIENVQNALAMLKEQEPRVLKYNEIEGHPLVWLEDDDKQDVIPAIFLQYNGWNAEFIRQAPSEHVSTVVRSATVYAVEKAYGVKWRCWTFRPSPEQMANTPWKEDDNAE